MPVGIGLAIAAANGFFEPISALLTVIGAAAVHLGLNVANDVFDTRLGADDANVNPTQYSGGSRVIQYGLVSLGGMQRLALLFYGIAMGAGLVLLALGLRPRSSSSVSWASSSASDTPRRRSSSSTGGWAS